jgi:Tol biopolymer transport system component
MSPDGPTFVLSSNRPGGFGDLDMWVTTRTSKGSPWSPPTNLGPSINTEYQEFPTSISPDGQWCYFMSDRPGGQGGGDIWQAPIIYNKTGKP